jgi:DNA adenine methylase
VEQLRIWEEELPERNPAEVVNVSKVPQLSPFRYPGGKTWLIPAVRHWLRSLEPKPQVLVEPFTGGGIVGLTAAAEELANRVVMVELDEDVAAVWKTMLGRECEWLVQRIMDFDLTREDVVAEIESNPRSVRQRAFQTILKNRAYHGGILAAGSGLPKAGENGRGISSRWYPETLARRLRKIHEMKSRIEFIEGDALEVMKDYKGDDSAVFFIDPPYTAAGKKAGRRLYRHSELDHRALFRLASQVAGDVLLTYDDAEGVRNLAAEFALSVDTVAMRNTHLRTMNELVIGRNLRWNQA